MAVAAGAQGPISGWGVGDDGIADIVRLGERMSISLRSAGS